MDNLEENIKKQPQSLSIGRCLDLALVPTSGIRLLERLKKRREVTNQDYWAVLILEATRLGIYAIAGAQIY